MIAPFRILEKELSLYPVPSPGEPALRERTISAGFAQRQVLAVADIPDSRTYLTLITFP
jgi:hypothetical protein